MAGYMKAVDCELTELNTSATHAQGPGRKRGEPLPAEYCKGARIFAFMWMDCPSSPLARPYRIRKAVYCSVSL